MQLLYNVVYLRLVQLLRLGIQNWYWSILLHCTILLLTVLQAIGVFKIFYKIVPVGIMSENGFMFLIKFSLFFVVLFLGFFPDYKPFQNLFLTTYPINDTKRTFIQSVYLLIEPIYFYLTIFISILFFLMHSLLPVSFFITLYIIMLSAFIVIQVVKIQLQSHLHSFRSLIVILLIFLLLKNFSASYLLLFFYIVIFSLLYLLYFDLHHSFRLYEKNNINPITFLNRNNRVFTILNTKNIRIVFITALLLKLIYGVLLIIMTLRGKFDDNYFLKLMLPVICSPIILFTYIFNNFFGFQRQIFFYVGYIDTVKSLRRYFFNSTIPILLMDFTLSFVMLVFAKLSLIEIFIFLFLATINCFFIGFIFSLMFPKKILKAIELHRFSNTHIGGSLLLIVLSILIAHCFDTNNYIILCVIELIIIFLFVVIYIYIKNNAERIYQNALKKLL